MGDAPPPRTPASLRTARGRTASRSPATLGRSSTRMGSRGKPRPPEAAEHCRTLPNTAEHCRTLGDRMSIAARTDLQPPATHVADSHDLIRLRGARVNNLQDVSLEIPKRRLTAFTGVSGSGKSSLVFGTIAAESQRLINETYSSFVQGFMPTLARPDVDVLDGLTTAII